jgi:hypothetical protein
VTMVDLVVTVFAASNTTRVLAYIPQVVRLVRDRDGARSVSCLTWALFAASNSSTAAYALLVVTDLRMVAIFAVNTACCIIIVALTLYKRIRLEGSAPPRLFETRQPIGRSGLIRPIAIEGACHES